MFLKTSFCDRLVCFAAFLGMTLLAIFFLLPLPNCFLSVCLPTLFAAVLKFFLPLTTSAISGAANSNKSVPTGSPVGTLYLGRTGTAVPPTTWANSPIPRTCISVECNLYLSWSNHLITFFTLQMNVGDISKHQSKKIKTDRYKRQI